MNTSTNTTNTNTNTDTNTTTNNTFDKQYTNIQTAASHCLMLPGDTSACEMNTHPNCGQRQTPRYPP